MTLNLFACLLSAVVLAQSTNPYFLKAQQHFDAFEYGLCLRDLELARTLASEPRDRAQAEVLHGLCAFHLGRRADAEARFELGLRLDSTVELPANTSPRIIAVFEATRDRLAKERPAVEAKEPAPPPDAPRVEVAPVKPPPAAPPPVLTPPVVKQPARSPTVPLILGAGAVVATGLAVGFGVNARALEARSNVLHFETDVAQAGRDARSSALAANVSYASAGALAVAALLAWVLQPAETVP